MSIIESDVNLFILGRRRYVQAPIQLKFAIESIKSENKITDLSKIYVNRYKQLQEVDSPLTIFPESYVEPQNTISATLAITLDDKPMEYKLAAIPGAVERRPDISYRQVEYRKHSDVEASIRLSEASDFWEVVNEAVQLTKVFHIEKYNVGIKYRFIVGGFERLRYSETSKGESIVIICRILRHIFHESTIYNYTRIEVKSASIRYSFLMPFIGKVIEK